jgi:hypothetical protein
MAATNDTFHPLPHEAQPAANLPPEAVHPTAANVPEAAKVHAERLVEELGSVELAKHAVDLARQAVDAVAEQAGATSVENVLHKSLGFTTQQELRDASTPLESNDGKTWYITHLADDSWIAWNETDYKSDRHYVTVEEARASVPHEAGFTGTSLLG